ncbi:MAG: RDD family protein [Myxococcaceae bacterium]|nr:RDD family protein [Myxococcaceae bacterium]
MQLDVATPERVGLSLPIAGIGYRSLAWLIDVSLILSFWVIAYFLYALTGPDVMKVVGGMSTFVRVAAVLGFFFFQWVYWTACEVLWRGQTPGKRFMKIRIVRSDGSPVGVLESAVRNLLRLVDFLPIGYGLGALVMLVDPKHRRLGDLAAGTVALREEQIDLSGYAAAPPAVAAATRELTPHEHELLRELVARFDGLEQPARLSLVQKLAARLGEDPAQISDDATARAWVRARAGTPPDQPARLP